MRFFEVVIDEMDITGGVNAISLVTSPAIDSQFITLKKAVDVQMKAVDEEKHLLMGAVLIPNKPILRNDTGEAYQIVFSKDTIRKSSELFLKNGYQGNTTEQHQFVLDGNVVVESWIKEDMVKDKSALYELSDPVGSWMVSMKIEDEDTWKKAKSGEIKGFSIEGFFLHELRDELKKYEELSSEKTDAERQINEIKEILKNE